MAKADLEEDQNDSNLIENKALMPYNKPSRRQTLLEIRRLIVDEGLSHQEIQIRLNLAPATYFRYLDILFQAEQQTVAGDSHTYQRLINETLILNQRYLRHARMLTEIGQDKNIDAEHRIEAHHLAADLERAVHDMTFFSPSYLILHKMVPTTPWTIGKVEQKNNINKLNYTAIPAFAEDKDEYHDEKVRAALAYRMKNIQRQEQELEQQSHTAQQPEPNG